MPWVEPSNVSTGDVLTASAWNQSVVENVAWLRALANVQIATKTDTQTLATGTFTDITGLSVTITPRRDTSKILVIASVAIGVQGGPHTASVRLIRGTSTSVGGGDASSSRTRGIGSFTGDDTNHQYMVLRCSHVFIDEPATTSATTYKAQAANGTGSYSMYINRSHADLDNTAGVRAASTLIAIELPT